VARSPAPRPASERLVIAGQQVELRRSSRRRRTVSAYRDGDLIIVLLPARLSAADEQSWVADMLARLTRRQAGRPARRSDEALLQRARLLSREHLAGLARPSSVRWVHNQESRWGSCTPIHGTIRLSHRLQQLPGWVVDYVLVHELAHLQEAGHGPAFWELVAHYPRAERARGYLEGIAAAAGLDLGELTGASDGPVDVPTDEIPADEEPTELRLF